MGDIPYVFLKEALGNRFELEPEQLQPRSYLTYQFEPSSESTFSLIVMFFDVDPLHFSLIVTRRALASDCDLRKVLLGCVGVNSRLRDCFFEFDKRTTTLRLRYEHMFRLTPVKKSLLAIVDRMIRLYDFYKPLVVHGLHRRAALSSEISTANEFMRRLANTLQFSNFTLDCHFKSVVLTANVDYMEKHVRLLRQDFIVVYQPETDSYEVRVQSKDRIGKSDSTGIDPLRVNEYVHWTDDCLIVWLKVQAWRFEELYTAARYILELYWETIGRLVQSGKVKCTKFPTHRIENIAWLADSLGTDIAAFNEEMSAFTDFDPSYEPQDIVDLPKHPYILISFSSENDYNRARAAYESLRREVLLKALPLFFPAVRFLSDDCSLYVDLSELIPIADMLANPHLVASRFLIIEKLFDAVSAVKSAGCSIDRLLDVSYMNPKTETIAILPLWRSSGICVSKGDIGLVVDYVLQELEAHSEISNVVCSKDELSTWLETHRKKGTDSASRIISQFNSVESLPLLQPFQETYWALVLLEKKQPLKYDYSVLADVSIWSNQQQSSTDKVQYSATPSQEGLEVTHMGSDKRAEILTKVGDCLKAAHSLGIAHLMLTPSDIHYDYGSQRVRIAGFVFSLSRINERFASENFLDFDFIDPAVLSYAWWSLNPEKAPEAQRKKQKYARMIDTRADVYSFALLFYHCLFKKDKPYGDELVEIENFFRTVVKQHHRPLIPPLFEKRFPEVTDALRRSWSDPRQRPALDELLSFLPKFPAFFNFNVKSEDGKSSVSSAPPKPSLSSQLAVSEI